MTCMTHPCQGSQVQGLPCLWQAPDAPQNCYIPGTASLADLANYMASFWLGERHPAVDSCSICFVSRQPTVALPEAQLTSLSSSSSILLLSIVVPLWHCGTANIFDVNPTFLLSMSLKHPQKSASQESMQRLIRLASLYLPVR